MPILSLFHFIGKNKSNREYLWAALGATIVQFISFKMLYPFPDFFSDSYSYLFAAQAHLGINIWPIGYSRFLQFFHWLTHSGTALVAFQYFFLETTALYFFYTILYFFRPKQSTTYILFIFLFANPLLLYLSNYVNSDPLFAALSLLWFTQLIWIIYRPGNILLFTHAVLLFLCFTVRNNAYYYPLITAIAFLLARKGLRWKLTGILAPFLLIIPFILYSRNEAFKMTGRHQFSLFTGWQLANNALYIYRGLPIDPAGLPSPAARELDSLTRQFDKSLIPDFNGFLDEYVGNFFIREPASPLKQYLVKNFSIKDDYAGVVAWGKASPVFEEFGIYIIERNPVAYFRDFVWLNTKNYFAPPLEKLEVYNLGTDQVGKIAADWFGFKNTRVKSASKDLQGVLLFVFSPLFFLMNIYLLIWATQYIIRRKYRTATPSHHKILLLTGSFLIANFCFCVFATIIVLRYEVVPLIIGTSISLLLLERYEKIEIQKNVTGELKMSELNV